MLSTYLLHIKTHLLKRISYEVNKNNTSILMRNLWLFMIRLVTGKKIST